MDLLKGMATELAIASLDTIALSVCIWNLSKLQRTLIALDDAPTLEINSELNEKIEREPNGTLKYAAIRGVVTPLGNLLKSKTDDGITGVAQKLTIKEHVVAKSSMGFWLDNTRTIYEIFNVAPFAITKNKIQVEIDDPRGAEILDMDLISDTFEPLNLSVFDHIWGYFMGYRQKGIQTTEQILRDGSVITAIGELTTREGGNLKLLTPKNGAPFFLITSTKTNLIKKIKESRDLLRIFTGIFGLVAVVLTGCMVYKYRKYRKEKTEKEDLKERLRRERKKNQTKDKNLSEDRLLCVVCSENPKEIILLPCGHVALCENCSDNIKDECPVCRAKIEQRTVFFIS